MVVQAGERLRGQIMRGVRGDEEEEGACWKCKKGQGIEPISPVLVQYLYCNHVAQVMWAPSLCVQCLPGGKPHLHSISIPVSSLSYLGLSNLCSCSTRIVHVGLRGLSMFISVKEKYDHLHWSHLF